VDENLGGCWYDIFLGRSTLWGGKQEMMYVLHHRERQCGYPLLHLKIFSHVSRKFLAASKVHHAGAILPKYGHSLWNCDTLAEFVPWSEQTEREIEVPKD